MLPTGDKKTGAWVRILLMLWFFMFLASLAGTLILVGHYERRIAALEANPRIQMRIVPRTLYEEQTGVDWVSNANALR